MRYQSTILSKYPRQVLSEFEHATDGLSQETKRIVQNVYDIAGADVKKGTTLLRHTAGKVEIVLKP